MNAKAGMQLLDLPTELLIDILRQLELREILRAQLICHAFDTLIRETAELQYAIEIAVAGVAECSPSLRSVSVADRLARLQARQRSWKDPRPTLVRAATLEGKYGRVDLTDGILVRTHLRSGPDDVLQYFDHLTAMVVNSNHEGGLPHWDFDFDAEMIELAMDPSQDLLVLIDDLSPPDSNEFRCRLHMLSLTTGEPHPLAQLSTLEVPGSPEAPSNIIGDLIAFFVTHTEARPSTADRAAVMGDGMVCFLNWKTGVLRTMPLKGKFPLEGALCLLPCGYFLLSSLHRRPDNEHEHIAINLYTVENDLGSNAPKLSPKLPAWYKHIAAFELPRLLDDSLDYVFSLDFHCSGFCRRATAYPEFGEPPPFQTDPYLGIVGIEITRDVFPPPADPPPPGLQWMLVIDTKLFLQEEARQRQSATIRIDDQQPVRYHWDQWGPQSGCWFVGAFPQFVTRDHMYGRRLVLRDVLYDFNELEIKRDRARFLYSGEAPPGWKNVHDCAEEPCDPNDSAFFDVAELGKSCVSYRLTPIEIPEDKEAVLWIDEGIVAISREKRAEVHIYYV